MSNTIPFPAPPPPTKPLVPQEGWYVQHLFYHVDTGVWAALTEEEQRERKTRFAELVKDVREHPKTQLLTLGMVGPKSDLGFMLLTPDLHDSQRFEKQLSLALGPDVLVPTYSYLSMTEWTEYSEKEEDASARIAKEGLEAGSEAHTKRLEEWKAHMSKYYNDRLYPNMADWQVFCFYPMNKRRGGEGQNWYALNFEQRRQLMSGHARVGRMWAGKVRQLITGSTGMDTHEWGVTLFAHDLFHIKGIVYEMRFDEVSAQYAEFGHFYIGIQLPVDELLRRLQIA
jgi:hydrogen peroxide-dependent heme synthase